MPHFVTALFDDHAKASAALQALIEMGVTRNHIVAIGLMDGRDVSSISGFRSLSAQEDPGTALSSLGLPADDRATFERGLLAGYALVGGQVTPSEMDRAIDVLDMFGPLELDGPAQDRLASRPAEAGDLGRPLAAGITGGNAEGQTNTGALPGMKSMIDGSDDLGTGDLQTEESARSQGGAGSTVSTGDRRDDRRTDLEGVTGLVSPDPAPVPGGGPMQRVTNRGGRVWAFGTQDT
ncbi:hypothetical protein [Microvirga pudoricolor]|uniref:hypothetical protein n=1 Tax=Microvirga pudoricolor TaxID=2778729 RepID=UPI001951605A|nr:hypothetical protein [Microvirga pudoricolor]MBM6594769.1 hypothetical protein [Microvirga pudoricolor]